MILNKRIIESIEKKFICIYDLFKTSENSNIQNLNQHIKKEFIDKYITFYKDNEIEDIEFNDSDDYIEEGKIDTYKNKNKNKNKGNIQNVNNNNENYNYNDNNSSDFNNSFEFGDEATYTILNEHNKKIRIEEKKYLLRNKSIINESDKEVERIIDKNSRKKKKNEGNKETKNKIIKEKKEIKNNNKSISHKNNSVKNITIKNNFEGFGNIEIRIDQEEQRYFLRQKEKEKEKKQQNEISKIQKVKKEKEQPKIIIQSKSQKNGSLSQKNNTNNIKKNKLSKFNGKKNNSKIEEDTSEKTEKEEENNSNDIIINNSNGDNNTKKSKYNLRKKFNLDNIDLNNMKKVNIIISNKKQNKIFNNDNLEKYINANLNKINSEFLNKKRKLSSKSSKNFRDELKKLDLTNLI